MKKIILFALLAIAQSSSFGQKIVKNEVDAFTGSKIKETSYVTISDGFTCSIRVVNDTPVLMAGFNGGRKIHTMDKGERFMLKLENDSIVELYNMETSTSEYVDFSVGRTNISYFLLKTKYLLQEEQLINLKANKISVVRFYTTDGYIERKVSKENSGKLLKLFNLI